MFNMENKENDGKSQDEKSNNKLSGNSSYTKVRRSVLKEFDPFAPDSPLASKSNQPLAADDDEVFEDAQAYLPSLPWEATSINTSYNNRESILIPELKDYRPGHCQNLNDTGDMSFAECLENLSHFNVNSSDDDIEFNYKTKSNETVVKSQPEKAEMDKTFETSSTVDHENIDSGVTEQLKQSQIDINAADIKICEKDSEIEPQNNERNNFTELQAVCHDDALQNETFDISQIPQDGSIKAENQNNVAEQPCDMAPVSPDNSFNSQKSLETTNDDEHQIIFVDIQLNRTLVDSSMTDQNINSNDADPLNIDAGDNHTDQAILHSYVVNDGDPELRHSDEIIRLEDNSQNHNVLESGVQNSNSLQNNEKPLNLEIPNVSLTVPGNRHLDVTTNVSESLENRNLDGDTIKVIPSKSEAITIPYVVSDSELAVESDIILDSAAGIHDHENNAQLHTLFETTTDTQYHTKNEVLCDVELNKADSLSATHSSVNALIHHTEVEIQASEANAENKNGYSFKVENYSATKDESVSRSQDNSEVLNVFKDEPNQVESLFTVTKLAFVGNENTSLEQSIAFQNHSEVECQGDGDVLRGEVENAVRLEKTIKESSSNSTFLQSQMYNEISITETNVEPTMAALSFNQNSTVTVCHENLETSSEESANIVHSLKIHNETQSQAEVDNETAFKVEHEHVTKDEVIPHTGSEIQLGTNKTFEVIQLRDTKDEHIPQSQVNIESIGKIDIVGEKNEALSFIQNSTDTVTASNENEETSSEESIQTSVALNTSNEPETKIEASAEVSLSILEGGSKINDATSNIERIGESVLDTVDDVIAQAQAKTEVEIDSNKAESLAVVQTPTTDTEAVCGDNDHIGSAKSINDCVALKIKDNVDPQAELDKTFEANAENHPPVLENCYKGEGVPDPNEAECLSVVQISTIKGTVSEENEDADFKQTIIMSEGLKVDSDVKPESEINRTFEHGAKDNTPILKDGCEQNDTAKKTEDKEAADEIVSRSQAKIKPGETTTEDMNPVCDNKGEVVQATLCNTDAVVIEAVIDGSKTLETNAEQNLDHDSELNSFIEIPNQEKTSSVQVQLDGAFSDQKVPESQINNETDDQKAAVLLEDHPTAVDLEENSDFVQGEVDGKSKKAPEISEEAQLENRVLEEISEDQKIVNSSVIPKEDTESQSPPNLNNKRPEGSVERHDILKDKAEHIETDRTDLLTMAAPSIQDVADSDKAVEALAASLNQTIDVEETAIVDEIDLTDTSGDNLDVTIETKSNTRHEAIIDSVEKEAIQATCDIKQEPNIDMISGKEPDVETSTTPAQLPEKIETMNERTKINSEELALKLKSIDCDDAEPNTDVIIDKESVIETSAASVREKAKTNSEELESVGTELTRIVMKEKDLSGDAVVQSKTHSSQQKSGPQRPECRPNIRLLRNKTQVIANPLLVKSANANDLNEELLKEYKLRSDQLKQQVNQLQSEMEKLAAENVQKDQCILSHALSRESDRNTIVNYKALVQEYQKHISKQCEELCLLKSQSEELARQFTNTEMAFSQVFERYEKAKRVIEAYRRNEEILMQNIKNAENQLAQLEAKCKTIQDRCNRDVKKAQEQLDQEKENYKGSISKLKAMVKRLEIKAASLETAVKQKTEECQALASLCDDITGRQPT